MKFNKVTASTKELRNAVREAMYRMRVTELKSWTEVLRKELNTGFRSEQRMVCFKFDETQVNISNMAFLTEYILNESGKTARVKVGKRSNNYIRGICSGVNFRKTPSKNPKFHKYKAKD
jgi:hypothetical protein